MNNDDKGWIGVDLDGTLAEFRDGDWKDIIDIGEPIMPMVERVKEWLAAGEEVRIFTARAQPMFGVRDEAAIAQFRLALYTWTLEHVGQALEATATKDFRMKQLWDDRAIQVEPNTGRAIEEAGTPCPLCSVPMLGSCQRVEGVVDAHLRCFGCGAVFVKTSVEGGELLN
jgi:hypothetical protein